MKTALQGITSLSLTSLRCRLWARGLKYYSARHINRLFVRRVQFQFDTPEHTVASGQCRCLQ
jgi:hypothetical protein